MVHRERTWIEISASAVRQNLRSFQRLVGPRVGIMPVIKANAYGHGLTELATILRREKTSAYGVAYGEEALHLRASGYRGRIVVLSSWQPSDLPQLIQKNIELVTWDWQSFDAINAAAKRSQRRPMVHLKLDTGTTRIGFLLSDLPKLQRIVIQESRLKIVGLFSHFANAEERSMRRTNEQLKRFTTHNNTLSLPGRVERHISCTAAILRYPEAYFGLVRLGIGLYGLWPSDAIQAWVNADNPKFRLEPALAWYTRLAQVKTVPKGTGIGYGSTVIAKRPTRVGVLPIGYADGYDRRLSNSGWVIVHGRRAPVLGRVCMNLVMVDVTNIPTASVHDHVTLLGPGVSVADWSHTTSALNYELVTRLSPLLPRYIV